MPVPLAYPAGPGFQSIRFALPADLGGLGVYSLSANRHRLVYDSMNKTDPDTTGLGTPTVYNPSYSDVGQTAAASETTSTTGTINYTSPSISWGDGDCLVMMAFSAWHNTAAATFTITDPGILSWTSRGTATWENSGRRITVQCWTSDNISGANSDTFTIQGNCGAATTDTNYVWVKFFKVTTGTFKQAVVQASDPGGFGNGTTDLDSYTITAPESTSSVLLGGLVAFSFDHFDPGTPSGFTQLEERYWGPALVNDGRLNMQVWNQTGTPTAFSWIRAGDDWDQAAIVVEYGKKTVTPTVNLYTGQPYVGVRAS